MSEKYQWFNGFKFTRDDKTGYYLNSTIHKRMHIYVWEFYSGEIPSGFEVHHIDGDKSNNDISNLELLESHAHKKYHGSILTEEAREWRRVNLEVNARPKASEWHKSDNGREWHKQQYERTAEKLHQKFEFTCINCGKVFQGEYGSKYCCNACKSAYRRKQNKDITYETTCVICGKSFMTNKFRVAKCCSKSCSAKLSHQNRG